ncbi:hypothetical protein [Neobacillus kokaensis]|uniref:Sporulation protein n=1 Tax=Neobacillus kokaensis TaxID=2759023 RepID=A0ABQ3N2E3_9BACI|nr:hypothetical protein [Neobacillus kokaensis]GHH98025.1 hypothetical protein AM1BK_15680 [Neobacillus kokaensis]
MKRNWKIWGVPFVGALLVLGACTSQQEFHKNEANAAENLHDNSLNERGNGHVQGTNNPDVIPSVDRSKKHTTKTTEGMGTNVYSLIGSSSLHDGGISSHLESRLAGEGITGIKVFVLDDTVILARSKPEATSTRYDEMQNKVLKGTTGLSGKGSFDGVDETDVNTDDNLDQAKKLMNKAFDGQVQILTVTNPNAITLIDRIKSTIKVDNPSYSRLTRDITALIKMTREK